jgi:hypothetical protein
MASRSQKIWQKPKQSSLQESTQTSFAIRITTLHKNRKCACNLKRARVRLSSGTLSMAPSFCICLCLSLYLWLSVQAQDPRHRAAELLKKMTAAEKFNMVQGVDADYVGMLRACYWYSYRSLSGLVPAIPRLNIPSLHLEDGPQVSFFFPCFSSSSLTRRVWRTV